MPVLTPKTRDRVAQPAACNVYRRCFSRLLALQPNPTHSFRSYFALSIDLSYTLLYNYPAAQCRHHTRARIFIEAVSPGVTPYSTYSGRLLVSRRLLDVDRLALEEYQGRESSVTGQAKDF